MKSLRYFFVLCLFSLISIGASGEIVSGNCGTDGDNLTWSYDTETTVLTILGSGSMGFVEWDYEWEEWVSTDTAPWSAYEEVISKLVIGESVNTIVSKAFSNCSCITEIISYNPEPPTISGESSFFSSYVFENAKLYVPSNCKSAYIAATGWSLFNNNNISEIVSEIVSGNCGTDGDNLTWSYDTETTVLTILGSGSMGFVEWDPEWEEWVSTDTAPWSAYEEVISKLVIGESVNTIVSKAFSNCSCITEIISYNPEPPTISGESSFLSSSVFENAKLYVPSNCKSAYIAATGWSLFNNNNISEIVSEKTWSFNPLTAIDKTAVSGGNLTGCITDDAGISWSYLYNNVAITKAELTIADGVVYPNSSGLKFTAEGTKWIYFRNYPEANNGAQLFSNNKDLRMFVPAAAGKAIIFKAMSANNTIQLKALKGAGADTVIVNIPFYGNGKYDYYMFTASADTVEFNLPKQFTMQEVKVCDVPTQADNTLAVAGGNNVTLSLGETKTLAFENQNNATTPITYKSLNEAVVTVENGVLTAVSSGETQVEVAQGANPYYKAATQVINVTVGQTYEVYYQQDYEAGDTIDWISTVTGRHTPVLYKDSTTVDGTTWTYNTYLAANASQRNNNGGTMYTSNTTTKGKTATPLLEAGKEFTMSFDLRLAAGNNQTPAFTIYDANIAQPIFSLTSTAKNTTTWKINNDASIVVDLLGSANDKTTTQALYTNKPWYNFKITYVCNTTFLTIKDIAADTLVVDGMVIPTLTGVGGVGRMQWATGRYYAAFAIDNVLIREPLASDYSQEYVKSSYTVNYLDEAGQAIRTARTGNIFAGFNIVPIASDINPVYTYDDVVTDSVIAKKIYESGLDTLVADADPAKNVINLVFRDAYIYKVTCKSVGMPIEKDFTPYDYRVSSKFKNVFEGETFYVYYPEFVQVGDSLWYKASESQQYRRAITPTGSIKETIEYTNNYTVMGTTANSKIHCIPDIVFFSEAEDIPTLTRVETQYVQMRCSNGAGGFPLKDAEITTLEPGTYRLCQQDRSANNPIYTYVIGNDTILMPGTAGTTQSSTSVDFVVEETTSVKILGLDSATTTYFNDGSAIDWIYIQKVNRIPANLVVNPASCTLVGVGAKDTITWIADNPASPTFENLNPTISSFDWWGALEAISVGRDTIKVALAETVYYLADTVLVPVTVYNEYATLPSLASSAYFSWQAPQGVAEAVGGTAVAVGDTTRVNYGNGTTDFLQYYNTISLCGKNDLSDGKYVNIMLNQAVATNDTIILTGYLNNGIEGKKSSARFYFGETYIDDGTDGFGYNDLALNPTAGLSTVRLVVPASVKGATTFKMTRGETDADLFITQMQIVPYQAPADSDSTEADTDISQFDNIMYIQDKSVFSDSQITLPVYLKNNVDMTAFSFDLVLPTGMTVAKNTNGKNIITLAENRKSDDHTITSNTLEDGIVSVACLSLSSETFLGNDGIIAYVTVNVDESMVDGNYNVFLKNVRMATPSNVEYKVSKVVSTLTVESYIPGDVNNDRELTIVDAVGIVNFIIQGNTDGLNRKAADANQDGEISIVDAVYVINKVIGADVSAKSEWEEKSNVVSSLEMSDKNIGNAESFEMPILLNSKAYDFTAMQCNIQLPSGLTLEEVETDESHVVIFNAMKEATIRIACLSIDNSAFAGNGNTLLTLKLRRDASFTSGTITLDGTELATHALSTAHPAAVKATISTSDVTSIESLSTANANANAIYNISGQKINNNFKGVVIKDGKKSLKK